MAIDDRYASAIRSSNLRSKPETTQSDSDVLGAAGLAAKQKPLAIALARLLAGDNKATPEIVGILSSWAYTHARANRVRLLRVESVDLARSVLAWRRDGICRACSGRGWQTVAGSPYLSAEQCDACKGTAKRQFDAEFRAAHRPIAGLVLAILDRELARAGPAVMEYLRPRLDL